MSDDLKYALHVAEECRLRAEKAERERDEARLVLEAAEEYEQAWNAYREAPHMQGDYLRVTAAKHILLVEVRCFRERSQNATTCDAARAAGEGGRDD